MIDGIESLCKVQRIDGSKMIIVEITKQRREAIPSSCYVTDEN